MAKIKTEDFIASLKEMTLLEITEWVDAMKDVYKRQQKVLEIILGMKEKK